MNKTKRIFALALVTVLICAASAAGSYAYFTDSKSITNTFVFASDSLLNNGGITIDKFGNSGFTDTNLVNFSVEAADSDVAGYVRVKISGCWKDDKNNLIMGDQWLSGSIDYNETDWYYNSDDGYYYYRRPLAPGEKTEKLLNTDIPTNEIDGDRQTISFASEIIQAEPASVIEECWGVSIEELRTR